MTLLILVFIIVIGTYKLSRILVLKTDFPEPVLSDGPTLVLFV